MNCTLFGITSMMTLTAIAVDRCLAITRPLALLGGVSRGWLLAVLVGVWLYSLGWSLLLFFGWSAYVPEGLQTSCSWDYMSFTAAVRTYTILLFAFVFFVPLGLIAGCYFAIFLAVRRAGREVEQLNCGETNKAYERLCSEWRLAKVALGVILLFIVFWSRLQEKDLRSFFSSSSALPRRATLTSQSSQGVRLSASVQPNRCWRKTSVTDGESCWMESEADSSSVRSAAVTRQVSPTPPSSVSAGDRQDRQLQVLTLTHLMGALQQRLNLYFHCDTCCRFSSAPFMRKDDFKMKKKKLSGVENVLM